VPIESVASASTLGLAAHWPFDDAAPSPAAADVSGHGHDCVLRRLDPTRAWVPGNVSGAVELGFNGWLECRQPHLPARASTSLSVGAWVKRAGNPRYHHAIATRPMPSGPANYFYFGFRDDQLMVMGHGWKGVLSAPIAHTPGTWMHVAFTHGPDHETKLFVNGAEVARQSSPPRALPAITTPLFVGGGFAANDRTRVRQLFEGSIDDLRLYDRALTPEEIRGLASTSPARPTP
jgi:Concanavalin A-like lectin/glucanases superfamily